MIISYLLFVFAGFISGSSFHKKAGGRGILTGTLATLPIAFVSYLILILFSFKSLTVFSLIAPLVCILGGTSGGIVSSNTKKRY